MINSTQIMGRIGQAIKVTTMPSGDSVANFSLAVSDTYVDKKGQKVERTDWLNCVLFGTRADILSKWTSVGDRLHVTGQLRTGSYMKGEVKIPTVEIRVTDFEFIESAKKAA